MIIGYTPVLAKNLLVKYTRKNKKENSKEEKGGWEGEGRKEKENEKKEVEETEIYDDVNTWK